MTAGFLEASGGGGLHARGLLDDESADVAGGVGDLEPIPRRRVVQHRLGSSSRREQPAQVRDVGVQAGPRFRRAATASHAAVISESIADRPVAVHHQHRQHGPLLRGAQRHGAPSTVICSGPSTPNPIVFESGQLSPADAA